METVRDFILGAPKPLQMVTAAMKLKDTCSIENSYNLPRQHIEKQRHYFANKVLSSQSDGFPSSHVWMWEKWRKWKWSRSVMSNSLQPHESQHTRPPCPSPTPGVHSNSRPLSRWCHSAISSSVVPFSPAPNPSQHQSFLQKVSSFHLLAKVLELQLHHQSLQ